MATEEFAGPIDYLVFAFDRGADLGTGLLAVLERAKEGIVEILDIELVGRDTDGAAVTLPLADTQTATGLDPAVFSGLQSGLLDAEDLAGIADALEADQVAVAIVYEDRSLAVAAAAWATVGGAELFSGGVDVTELHDVLEERTGS
ncbi:DUF1269 domain-containing protein [Millisia brevis]|uniref:DUF1269 domain-containing protein n=1 Tax=Millisia brevis TaxID=264148 RepID=UPI0012ED1AB1|nr:DUF1269 domain-containing protein [Millisia brevis]